MHEIEILKKSYDSTTARSKYSLWKPITIYIELFVQYILLLPISNKILQVYRLFQPQNQ